MLCVLCLIVLWGFPLLLPIPVPTVDSRCLPKQYRAIVLPWLEASSMHRILSHRFPTHVISQQHSDMKVENMPADIRIEGNGSGGSTVTDTAVAPLPSAPETGPGEKDATQEPDQTETSPSTPKVESKPEETTSQVEATPEEPETTAPEQPDEPETIQVEETETPQAPAKPSYSSLLSKWLAYRFGGSARRMLMSVGVLKQEDDAMTDIGGAGNGMACSDHEVTQVWLLSCFPCPRNYL